VVDVILAQKKLSHGSRKFGKNVNSRDNASPIAFDGPDDAGSETQLNGP
jgi:hypothetical protein